jgi:hypothetical protein
MRKSVPTAATIAVNQVPNALDQTIMFCSSGGTDACVQGLV